jgi:protein-S-isoprenylcysteine O-methyltransferase Ste14
MPESRNDKANIIASPPLLYLCCSAVGVGANFLVPLPLLGFLGAYRLILGLFLFILSSLLFIWSIFLFRSFKTPNDPGKPTLCIITSGPFRFTRNPIYLAFIILHFGFSITIDSVWLFLMAPILFLLFHFGIVLREEAYLTTKFGSEYSQYLKKTRRWL